MVTWAVEHGIMVPRTLKANVRTAVAPGAASTRQRRSQSGSVRTRCSESSLVPFRTWDGVGEMAADRRDNSRSINRL